MCWGGNTNTNSYAKDELHRVISLLVSDLDGALPKSTWPVRPEKVGLQQLQIHHRAAAAVVFADLIAPYDATRAVVFIAQPLTSSSTAPEKCSGQLYATSYWCYQQL